MTVGERIKQKRIELCLSQDELAKRVGYKSRSSIQKIETARNLPLSKVEKMANALGCTPGYLMGWTTTPSGHQPPEIFVPQMPTYDFEYTDEEERIIMAYRKKDDTTKDIICKLLDVKRGKNASKDIG